MEKTENYEEMEDYRSEDTSGLIQEYRYLLKDIHEYIIYDLKWDKKLSFDTRQRVGMLVSRFISEMTGHYMYLPEWKELEFKKMKIEAGAELLDCLWGGNSYGKKKEDLIAVREKAKEIIDIFINLQF